DEPDRWEERLAGYERLRFIINVLTRLRLWSGGGRGDIRLKGPPPPPAPPCATPLSPPPPPPPSPLRPWFDHPQRASRDMRVIFGHWSALGFIERPDVLGLDTGCVWGGSLTAVDLDSDRPPVSVECAQYQQIG